MDQTALSAWQGKYMPNTPLPKSMQGYVPDPKDLTQQVGPGGKILPLPLFSNTAKVDQYLAILHGSDYQGVETVYRKTQPVQVADLMADVTKQMLAAVQVVHKAAMETQSDAVFAHPQ